MPYSLWYTLISSGDLSNACWLTEWMKWQRLLFIWNKPTEAIWASQAALVVKTAWQCRRQETWAWSLGQEDPLKEGMATPSSILVWRIPWTEESGRLLSLGLQSWTQLKHLCLHTGNWGSMFTLRSFCCSGTSSLASVSGVAAATGCAVSSQGGDSVDTAHVADSEGIFHIRAACSARSPTQFTAHLMAFICRFVCF